jgi:hypothetical protein
MTKLAEIQEAIRSLPAREQDVLRVWLDEAPLDVDRNSPKLETELLKAVRGPHGPLNKAEFEAIASKVERSRRARRSA